MRTGWYREVHVKSRQCRCWRSLLVARGTVLNEMRSIENVVRAILREAGIKLGTPSRTNFADRVRELASADVLVMPLVEPLLTILATMLRELAHLTKQVLDIVRTEKVCRHLMGVPGVGPITALTFRNRPSGSFPTFASGRSASRSDAGALPIGRNGRPGQDQPLRRRTRAHSALRSRPYAARPQPQVVIPAGLGREDRQAARHGTGACCSCPQARCRAAPHVERSNRVPLREGTEHARHSMRR